MLLAVVDTNVWISALINPSGYPARVAELLAEGRFALAVSPGMLEELESVLGRPRLAQRIGRARTTLFDLLLARAELVAEPPIQAVGRDPRDDLFISVAVAVGADCIVTRDDDLKRDLAVASFLAHSNTEVLSVSQFIERVDG